jgi:hypothetical protein
MHTYTQIFVAIETLLRASGCNCHHLVSVVDEANKYCYKTFDGKIGVVDKSFIHDRCKTLANSTTFCQ